MSIVVTAPLLQIPDNAAGLSLQTSADDLTTPGAWVEFIASTATEITIAGLCLDADEATVGTGIKIAFQYGIGASGSEVALNDWQFSDENNGQAGPGYQHLLELPIGPVPSGSRVCVRIKANKIIGASVCLASLIYYDDTFDSTHRTLAQETFAPANSGGVSITPSSTAYAASSWVELVSSMPQAGMLIGLSVLPLTGTENIWEIGFGAAGSEVVKTAIRGCVTGSAVVSNLDLPAPYPVPAGTRVAVRLKKSGTSTSTVGVTLRYFADLGTPPDVIQLVTQQVLLVFHDESVESEIGDGNVTIDTCTGGGTVPTGSDPGSGENLATATAPIPWVAITVGATTYRYAAATVPHAPERYGRVESFGSVTRDLSEPDAGPRAATMSVSLIDTDRVLRGIANAGTLKHALIEVFVSDLATIVAAGTPFREFRGRVSSWKAEAGLLFTINAEDELTARLTSMDAEDQPCGITLLDEVSDGNPENKTIGKPAPEVYGSVSDEDQDAPVGVWEPVYSSSRTFDEAPELGNNHVFPLSVGAVGQIQSAFCASPFEDPPVTRVRVPDSAWGVWLWAPTKPGYFGANDYFTDTTGVRWALLVGKDGHPSVEMARSGRIPFTVNLCGYETVGDASGNTITSIPRGFLHWINSRLLQDGADGAWPTSIFAIGDHSFIKTSTFATAHTILNGLGWVLGGVLGHDLQFESWRDRWAVWLRHLGYGAATGTNRHGQVILAMLDRSESYSSATAFGPDTILERGCEVNNRDDAVENVIRYVSRQNYKTKLQSLNPGEGERGLREPYDGPWLYTPDAIEDSTSITALGGTPRGRRQSAIQEYGLTRNEATADALAAERLDWLKLANGRAEVTFDLSLRHAFGLELGDVITLEHWDLPWSGARRCWVRGLAHNLDTHVVTVRVWDVDDLLA